MNYDTAVPVGRGAVGEVYKAWDPDLERWVALKYLRFHDAESVARMFAEARAQARIDHPNVCKVYQVGEENDRPFIAMQYIEGHPLDEVAADLSVERKVRLVRLVCDAVQAAHSASLIHRDLKPTNILVATEESGELTPYVVDFGIARELAVEGLTATGQALGTPGYMSPEQARGEVTTLDRRSDVFSLGVILYEILSGARPFAASSDFDSMVKVMQEDPRPLQDLDISPDLATIVSKCLEKERRLRYGSARELSEDLSRFLQGEAVHARPVGPVGRLIRRARRERKLATVIAVSSLLVVVLFGTLVVGAVKYTWDLRAERTAAVAARGDAEQVAEFLIELFQSSDPNKSLGETITARELLERGAARIEAELADYPLRRAHMLRVVGTVEYELGLFTVAQDHLQQAVDLNRSRPLPHLETGLSLHQLGKLLVERGAYAEAQPYTVEAVAVLRTTRPLEEQALAMSLNSLGVLYHNWGEREQAIPFYRESLEIYRRIYGSDHEAGAQPLENIALIDRELDTDERIAIFQRVLAIREKRLGNDHPDVGTTLLNLGMALHGSGESETGLGYLERSLAIREKTLGTKHAYVAYSANNVGAILVDIGLYSRAQPFLDQTLAIADEIFEPSHPMVLVLRANRSEAARELGQWEAAREELETAQEAIGQDLTQAPDYSFYIFHQQGKLDLALGRLDEALEGFETSLRLTGGEPGKSKYAFDAALAAARVLALQGQRTEARKALGTLESAIGKVDDTRLKEDPRRKSLNQIIAQLNLLECRPKEAYRWLSSALNQSEPDNNPATQADRAALEILAGHALQELGEESSSRAAWEQARDRLAPIVRDSKALRFHNLYQEALMALGEIEVEELNSSLPTVSGLAQWRWPSGFGAPCSATQKGD